MTKTWAIDCSECGNVVVVPEGSGPPDDWKYLLTDWGQARDYFCPSCADEREKSL